MLSTPEHRGLRRSVRVLAVQAVRPRPGIQALTDTSADATVWQRQAKLDQQEAAQVAMHRHPE
ncbi:hypothetical protein [Gordonia sp. (in: high G+C Gram-positive bacteria)]|jgi:hypothetical protein|uniref:hypothetical protein n=1 Tax=Gordonia sp. (in: high G+C Gram-positive bacteria) TaxID=84139 RepID=UPI00257CC6B2|nr:hypothetical protein [Gordonia sp. (in: high G+C Gram-positive bacteria)]